MKINNIQLPIICRCEPYSLGPNLGVFGESFGVKCKELSANQLIEFRIYNKDDFYQRGRCEFYLIYQGKRPNLRKIINKIGWIESYE